MSGLARPRIGCAGWSLGRRDAHLFGGGTSMLARYATRFDVVEINSSFYRPHRRTTYERWASSVPPGFRFSAKLPKAVTHEAGLQGVGGLLDAFLDEVGGLGEKLGGLLVQLPPGLAFDARVAAAFFTMLRRRSDVALACEPRHASWFTPVAAALLGRHDIARVAADPALSAEAARVGDAGPWRYWRWHGSPHRYYSNYPDAALLSLSEAIPAQTPDGIAPWIIFDNTASGFATTNALKMQLLLDPALRRGAA